MTRLLRRVRNRIRNRRFDADLAEELRFHEEMKRRELEAAGTSPADAQAPARRALGNVMLMREESRAVWIAPWVESIVHDVRYAVRTLVRRPSHSLTAGIALVLGIGLNASLFTVLKGVVFEPWPVRDSGRVVRIRVAGADGRGAGPSVDEYRFMREHAISFSGLVAHTSPGNGARLRAAGRPEKYLHPVWATANVFDVLGVGMHLGSGFIADDDIHGGGRAPLVISYALWRSYFNADPAVIGQTAYVAGKPFTVVGILEKRFYGIEQEPVDFWMPLSVISSVRPSGNIAWEPSTKSALCCIGMSARLGPGVSVEQARQELQLLHERFASANVSADSKQRKSGRVEMVGTARISSPGAGRVAILGVFAAAVVLILLLACANVANLQLARGLSRRREIATRLSIGASRARLVRQLLTEGFVLACVAGAIGIGVAAILPSVLLYAVDEELPHNLIDVDWQVGLFTLAICMLGCLSFGLLPALHSTRLSIPLGALDRASTRPGRLPLRSVLLGTQVAICSVLLVGAGLLTRAIFHAMSLDTGFDANGVTVVRVVLPPEGYTGAQRQEFAQALLAELEPNSPNPVALAAPLPFSSMSLVMRMILAHEQPIDRRSVRLRPVSREFFDLLGIPMTRGRMFESRAAGEAVVNATFARTYFGGEDPVGRTIHQLDSRTMSVGRVYTIVGVVRDAYLTGLDEIEPVIFRPATDGYFLTRGGPAAVERLRAAALALNPTATLTTHPLTDELRRHLEGARIGAALGWAIGLLGLTLAAVGVFGVFAYAVEERRREIGVRLALGAAPRQIVRVLLATSGRAMAVGLGAGFVLSLACGPALRSYLFGLSPLDPAAYALVCSILLVAGIVATFIPARRAWRVDPAVTLRED